MLVLHLNIASDGLWSLDGFIFALYFSHQEKFSEGDMVDWVKGAKGLIYLLYR